MTRNFCNRLLLCSFFFFCSQGSGASDVALVNALKLLRDEIKADSTDLNRVREYYNQAKRLGMNPEDFSYGSTVEKAVEKVDGDSDLTVNPMEQAAILQKVEVVKFLHKELGAPLGYEKYFSGNSAGTAALIRSKKMLDYLQSEGAIDEKLIRGQSRELLFKSLRQNEGSEQATILATLVKSGADIGKLDLSASRLSGFSQMDALLNWGSLHPETLKVLHENGFDFSKKQVGSENSSPIASLFEDMVKDFVSSNPKSRSKEYLEVLMRLGYDFSNWPTLATESLIRDRSYKRNLERLGQVLQGIAEKVSEEKSKEVQRGIAALQTGNYPPASPGLELSLAYNELLKEISAPKPDLKKIEELYREARAKGLDPYDYSKDSELFKATKANNFHRGYLSSPYKAASRSRNEDVLLLLSGPLKAPLFFEDNSHFPPADALISKEVTEKFIQRGIINAEAMNQDPKFLYHFLQNSEDFSDQLDILKKLVAAGANLKTLLEKNYAHRERSYLSSLLSMGSLSPDTVEYLHNQGIAFDVREPNMKSSSEVLVEMLTNSMVKNSHYPRVNDYIKMLLSLGYDFSEISHVIGEQIPKNGNYFENLAVVADSLARLQKEVAIEKESNTALSDSGKNRRRAYHRSNSHPSVRRARRTQSGSLSAHRIPR